MLQYETEDMLERLAVEERVSVHVDESAESPRLALWTISSAILSFRSTSAISFPFSTCHLRSHGKSVIPAIASTASSTSAMPKEQPKSAAAIPRQRPVSCRFCRTRKLRCSRDFPCSNCVSRGIQCEPDQAIESAPSATTILAPDPELLGRIRKLEERVESQESRKGKRVKHYGEGAQSHAGYASGSASSPQIDQLDDDVAWLESIYTGQDQTVDIYFQPFAGNGF